MKATKHLISLLRQLRDDVDRPWEATHPTFRAYVQDKFGWSERRQQQILKAEDTRMLLVDEAPDLEPTIQAMPERAVREIIQTPPDKRLEVLRKAIELTAKGKPSGPALRKARAIVTGSPVEPRAKLCPHCGGKL